MVVVRSLLTEDDRRVTDSGIDTRDVQSVAVTLSSLESVGSDAVSVRVGVTSLLSLDERDAEYGAD